MILNFTCQEKRKALENRTCCQTIRVSIDKFIKNRKCPKCGEKLIQIADHNIGFMECRNCPQDFFSDESLPKLHIWWNARNFHQKELGPKKFLGMGEITSIVKKKVKDITEEEACRDLIGEVWLPTIQTRAAKKLHQDGHDFEDHEFAQVWIEQLQEKKVVRAELIAWLLAKNKNLTLDSEIFILQWRWVE